MCVIGMAWRREEWGGEQFTKPVGGKRASPAEPAELLLRTV